MTSTIPPVSSSMANPESPKRATADPLQRRRRRGAKILTSSPLQSIVTGRLDRIVIYSLLAIMAVMFAFPLYSAVVKSLEVNGLGNYISLITEPVGTVTIWQTYLNSFAIGVVHAVLVVSVSATAGYAFSKLNFPGRELLFASVLMFLAVPGVALLVPVYSLTSNFGLFNNYIGVGLPEAAITIPFGVLLMRNYGRNVSDSLIEAAQLDGAGHFRIFTNVFLPLAKPVLVNLTVLCFIWSLQDFLWPAFVFTDPDMASAAQAVQTFSNALGRGAGDLAKYNASLVLLAVPAVLFVLFGLRFIVNGLTAGGDKE